MSLFLLSFMSCSDKNDDKIIKNTPANSIPKENPTVYVNNCIVQYAYPFAVEFSIQYMGGVRENCIGMYFQSTYVNYGDDMFDALASKYCDTAYNGLLNSGETILVDSISNISIVCNKDFDADYPANTELSGIFSLVFYSLEKYIKSGYSYEYPVENDKLGYWDLKWETKKITASKISAEESCLMLPSAKLVFDRLPPSSGIYTFEIEIKLSQKTLKNKVTMAF